MRAIVGTAGHIDHGKSALVRALTGIETDRLREERERGISIELGFAHLDLGGGEKAGIVDVPGHERFIRQMLAGAHGFDLVLMVVAADDGVMPQTEEHFEIVHLLGVKRALFVITKADMVDEDRLEDVRGEIEILAAGTRFEDAPTFTVSAIANTGVDELRAAIVERLTALEETRGSGPFRMPIDRSFVIHGHGVVVAGTAASGSVGVGDEIEILPGDKRARVRDVQVHSEKVDKAFAGQRVALNLAGVDREDAPRGRTVVTPGMQLTTDRIDARVEIRPLAKREVRSHDRVRLYVGTAEALGRIVWLDETDTVAPRDSAFCQLVLREPIAASTGDHFVLRDETAAVTLGGGTVLVARAEKHKRSKGPVTSVLERLETGSEIERLVAFLELGPDLGVPPHELALGLSLTEAETIARATDHPEVIGLPPGSDDVQSIALRARFDAYGERLVAAVSAFHAGAPEQVGIDLETLRTSVNPPLEGRMFRAVIEDAAARGVLVRRGSHVHLPSHAASLSAGDDSVAGDVERLVCEAGAMPPTVKELCETLGIDSKRLAKVAGVLVERGVLVKVKSDLYYGQAALDEITSALRSNLQQSGEITAAQFRDLIGASRKYCIPLLDHFDRTGLTVRVGDFRRLRGAS